MADSAELIAWLDELLDPTAFDAGTERAPGTGRAGAAARGTRVTAQRALFWGRPSTSRSQASAAARRSPSPCPPRTCSVLLAERFAIEHVWIDIPNPV